LISALNSLERSTGCTVVLNAAVISYRSICSSVILAESSKSLCVNSKVAVTNTVRAAAV
jgi:predicted solute-binding protein